MRPTLIQRFFANDWPIRLALAAGILGFMAATASTYLPVLQLRAADILWFVFLLLISGILGFFAVILGAFLFLSPLYHTQGLRNGAPYRAGDWVYILAGTQRGRVARVYEVWDSRLQVRVDLGEEERRKVLDVFSYTQVCRHPAPESPEVSVTCASDPSK